LNFPPPPPSLQLPILTEDLPGSWPGRYMRTGQLLTTQSLRYHSLSGTIKLQPPLYQPGQATWRVGSKVYVQYETFLVLVMIKSSCMRNHAHESVVYALGVRALALSLGILRALKSVRYCVLFLKIAGCFVNSIS
jgi:hypothetical protein